ncbi:nucleotidyltransferase family protein [Pedobacter gandavensis]|uniref:nucleotidyltransferase family protein n=1 Tax=Pedobacter gandavensis TaxID=2679963 RepID=UPI00293122AD|nr:nucleotidyltransferase family protein [Pedobacter gandavensis]
MIILAAGNSSRLGKPKQLLNYQGETLLGIVSKAAIETTCEPVVVVLGAYAQEISANHHHPAIQYVINEHWEKGMSSSIAVGISAVLAQDKDIQQLIIAVSDQPFISAEVFKTLMSTQSKTNKGIVASSYANTTGTPVLFYKNYFPKLLSLQGNEGAKYLLNKYPEDCSSLVFELGDIDIDTTSDYDNLNFHR